MRPLAAPGPDGIVVRCLQEVAPTIVPILRSMFQRMLEEGTLPSIWRVARVLPIPKPGVDPHLAKGYRPIALLNVFSKVLEGVVKDRLSHVLEMGPLLSEAQQGFRQTRSTELALWRFVSSATRALKTRHRCIAVALDIESAYDTVDHIALLWKMMAKGVPRYLVAWTRAFLRDRRAQLVVNNGVFPYDIQVGVPQGSPLSPILFILFVDDLLEALEPLVQIQAFADDLLLWDILSSRSSCPSRIQQALDIVGNWSLQWGLRFNVSKCKVLDITRLRGLGRLFLHVSGDLIPQVQEFKYLGIWVDATLSWDRHIRETYNACMERLHYLRRFCATYWGMHPQVMAVLVQVVIFPHLFYGVCAWGGVGRFLKHLRPLDRILRIAAILTLGLLSTTSTVKAIAVCGWLPADLAIRFELFRFLLRQRSYGRMDLLDQNHVVGVNQIISALDTARREVQRFSRTSVTSRIGWEHLDPVMIGTHAPWDAAPPLTIRFPSRESVVDELATAQARDSGVWIYTDGSLLQGGCGAAAFVDDAGGPFGVATLTTKLGPLHSITDAELAGIRLALDHLATRTDWTEAHIVSDSQAALRQVLGARWRPTRLTILEIYQESRALLCAGPQITFWWVPGHVGIPGNERADQLARAAAISMTHQPMAWKVSRSMLERAIRHWFHERACASERALAGMIVDETEDIILRSNLRWLRDMPSRFMAARVGQFLSSHFPTGTYLHRFHHAPSPMCGCCGVLDTRAHLLLYCHRWTFVRQRISQWLCEEEPPREGSIGVQPAWTWEFLVTSQMGRVWLGRFLVAIRPHWSMRDQIRSEVVATSSEEG